MDGPCFKTYGFSCWFADEVKAALYLDNQLVNETSWKAVSQQCWDQRFFLDLDRVYYQLAVRIQSLIQSLLIKCKASALFRSYALRGLIVPLWFWLLGLSFRWRLLLSTTKDNFVISWLHLISTPLFSNGIQVLILSYCCYSVMSRVVQKTPDQSLLDLHLI